MGLHIQPEARASHELNDVSWNLGFGFHCLHIVVSQSPNRTLFEYLIGHFCEDEDESRQDVWRGNR